MFLGLKNTHLEKTSKRMVFALMLGSLLLSSFGTVTHLAFGQMASISSQAGLAGEWNFEDNTNDTSGNNNNGDGTTYVQGNIGQALSCDGTDDVVTVANSPTLNFNNTASFSISLWMKSNQSGTGNAGFGWLVDHRRNNDGVYAGYTIGDASGTIYARIRDSSGNDVPVASTTNVNDDKFHHIVFVVNRTAQTEQLYVDDNMQSSANITKVGNIDTNFDLHFGGTAYPNTPVNFFSGVLDQVRIYSKALSSSDVQELYSETGSSQIPIAELVGEWKFDGNTFDTSGTGNNGDGTTYVDGKIGQALSTDGTDDVVTVPNSPSLNFGTSSFSISLWMKSNQSGTGNAGFGWLVDHRSNNDGVYAGYTIGDASGTIYARIRDSSGHDVPVISTTNLNDNKFHHIVFVVDRATQTESLYVDDVLQSTALISSVGNINTYVNLHFGGTAYPNTPVNFFSGVLDQVRIYDKALTGTEMSVS